MKISFDIFENKAFCFFKPTNNIFMYIYLYIQVHLKKFEYCKKVIFSILYIYIYIYILGMGHDFLIFD